MNFLLFFLSLIDIFSGFFLFFSLKFELLYATLFLKGVWTLLSTLPLKDSLGVFLGLIDFMGGLLGFLNIFEFKIVGVFLIIKGAYSIIFSF